MSFYIVGQAETQARLSRQLWEGRVPHAQLFCGPEGSGKLPLAMGFARTLLCQHPVDGHACGSCPSCKMSFNLVHPDLHFVFPVIKPKDQGGQVVSDQFLKEWRELWCRTPYFDRQDWLEVMGVQNQQAQISVAESDHILRKLSLTSSQGGYRVVIVWLPELMNVQAANKLLKLIEEPPQQTVFLLVSDRPEQLLATILSRTQRVNVPALPADDIAAALVQQQGLQAEDARRIARQSDGNFVQALRLITVNADAALFFDMFVMLMRLSYKRDIRGIKKWADGVSDWGRERQKSFMVNCLRLVRENFVFNFQNGALNRMSREEADFAVRFASFINERNVIPVTEEMEAVIRDISQNVNPKMVFFDFGLKMIVLLMS